MKRKTVRSLSESAQQQLTFYESYLRSQQDLSLETIRNYLSDLRQFVAWYETLCTSQENSSFRLAQITTPTLIRYRSYLQSELKLAQACY